MTSKECLEVIKNLLKNKIADTDDLLEEIETDLNKLEQYRVLVNKYADMKGRSLIISLDETVKAFEEIERK